MYSVKLDSDVKIYKHTLLYLLRYEKELFSVCIVGKIEKCRILIDRYAVRNSDENQRLKKVMIRRSMLTHIQYDRYLILIL